MRLTSAPPIERAIALKRSSERWVEEATGAPLRRPMRTKRVNRAEFNWLDTIVRLR